MGGSAQSHGRGERAADRRQGGDPRPTVVLAGVDEAGYGPLLGPLVIGCAVFRVPVVDVDSANGQALPNLWKMLDPVVGKDPRGPDARHRVLVCDSKRLHSTSSLRPLEETVLTFSAAQSLIGRAPVAVGGDSGTDTASVVNVCNVRSEAAPPVDLFEAASRPEADAPGEIAAPTALPPDFAAFLARHSLVRADGDGDAAWFAARTLHAHPLPRAAVDAKCHGRAERLAERMRETGAELLGVRVRPVPVPEFNAGVARTGNKGASHIQWILGVVAQLWRRYPHAVVVLDRLGGRQRYGPALERAFPGATLASTREGPAGEDGEVQFSRYELVAPPTPDDPLGVAERRLSLAFLQEAEEQSLPVALASCFAKYTRECYVELMNQHFAQLVAPAELKPTKGYYQDGRRFLADLRAAGVDVDSLAADLIRQR